MLTVLEEKDVEKFPNVSDLLKGENNLTVLYFTATWCGPCKAIAPYVQTLADKHPSVAFYKIDVDMFEELTMSAGVNCMPTFQAYVKNVETPSVLEGADQEALEQMVSNLL